MKLIKIEGNKLADPSEQYTILLRGDTIYEANDFKELVSAVVGSSYLDCESVETEWHMRINEAKKIGLYLTAAEDQDKTIVYDYRIGKIPYSYTDANPDYDIPADPELIHIENDETFIYSLIKMNYIKVWTKDDQDYKLLNLDLDVEIKKELEKFKGKETNIPLHQKIEF